MLIIIIFFLKQTKADKNISHHKRQRLCLNDPIYVFNINRSCSTTIIILHKPC
jgi:hypothetical protein